MKSGARTTEIVGSTIEDGPDGTASYLIDIVSGEAAVIADNTLDKGARSENRETVIHFSGTVPAGAPGYRITGNRLRSEVPQEIVFVRNRTTVPAILEGNELEGEVVSLVGPGHRRRPSPRSAPRRQHLARARRRSRPRDRRPGPISRPSCASSSDCSIRR